MDVQIALGADIADGRSTSARSIQRTAARARRSLDLTLRVGEAEQGLF